MADGISVSAITKPTADALRDVQRRIDRSSMYAVRESGRVAKRAMKAGAPVYQGKNSVSVRSVKKARKAGVTLTGERLSKGGLVEGKGQVVSGALRDSIASSRRLKKEGDTYSLKVGPRGPRTFLYAGKQEARVHYTEKAFAEVAAAAREIHERAWAKAMKR